jgi:hypothetical protein
MLKEKMVGFIQRLLVGLLKAFHTNRGNVMSGEEIVILKYVVKTIITIFKFLFLLTRDIEKG